MLVGVMAPYEAGFYLSRGNMTTCRMQGFLIQLGQTASMFYNLFLSFYFYLVVVRSWREHSFKTIVRWVHVLVVMSGVGLAVGARQFIAPQFGVCGILPPLTASQWEVSLFYTAPVSIVLFTLTASTAALCWYVNKQYGRAQRWRFGKSKNNKSLAITREVFWQSFWYVSAFYVTVPLMLLSYYVPFQFPRDFWIFVVTAILAPLQGLMNAMVYFYRSKLWPSSCGLVGGWYQLMVNCRRKTTKEDKVQRSSAPSTDVLDQTDQPTPKQVTAQNPPEDPPHPEPEENGPERGAPFEAAPKIVDEDEASISQPIVGSEKEEEGTAGMQSFEDSAAVMEFWTLNESSYIAFSKDFPVSSVVSNEASLRGLVAFRLERSAE